MNKEKCVLVCGVGERASAVARRLLGEGYAVVLHQETPPRTLRRRMSFADAWFDGIATLNAVEARLARSSSEFLRGMQTRQFIPVLLRPFAEVVERWPWDAIIAAPDEHDRPPPRLLDLAELTISIAEGAVPGADCDLAILAEGPDPGAVLRPGETRPNRPPAYDRRALERWDVIAPCAGVLDAMTAIGERVRAGDAIACLGGEEILAPVGGRVSGLARPEQRAFPGMPVAEITVADTAPVAGVSDRNKLIARSVAFVLEMEGQGWTPVPFGAGN
jgi:xanthine dehydrogenase accessory factor